MTERYVRVRQAADDDLLDIFVYSCGKFGIVTAESYVRRLEAGIQQLTEHPKLGRWIEQTLTEMYALPVASHVIYYQVTDRTIDIIRILHKSMLPEKHLSEITG